MDFSADSLKAIYYGVWLLFVALLGWNGWRQGVARQLMTLVAIGCAYAAAFYGASSAAPIFAFLKYPQQITTLIGGSAVGCATFLALHGLRRVFFKRTAQHQGKGARLSFGILGATVGVAFGSLIFLVTTVFLSKAIGVAAQSRVEQHEREIREHVQIPSEEPGPLIRNFAKLGTALDEGASGRFLHRYDNTSMARAFATIAKLTIMVSRPEAVDRFLSYPGVEKLTRHPKLLAVKNDPAVAELLVSHSFIKLLRHEKVLALAGDAEFNALMQQMEFEKALEFALKPPKPPEPVPEPKPELVQPPAPSEAIDPAVPLAPQ